MFFATIDNLNGLKAEYRRLALMHHPDRGGDLDTMKAINIEYESRFEQLKRLHNAKASADTSGKTRATTETAAEFIDIINALLKLDGLTVELCGCCLLYTSSSISSTCKTPPCFQTKSLGVKPQPLRIFHIRRNAIAL